MIAPIPWLADLVQPWCEYLNLPTLPLHIHEVVISALLYSVIFWPISPILSNLLVPEHYATLPRKKRLNWDTHVVSMIQSCLISGLAIWVIAADNERWNMDWEERVWGYTGASGMIQGLSAGYFVWDLFVTSFNLDVFGIGTLAHAVAALLVFSLGFVCRTRFLVSILGPPQTLTDYLLHPSVRLSITTRASSYCGSSRRPSSTFTGLWTNCT